MMLVFLNKMGHLTKKNVGGTRFYPSGIDWKLIGLDEKCLYMVIQGDWLKNESDL